MISKTRKLTLVISCVLILCAALAGCMNAGNRVNEAAQTPDVTKGASVMPNSTSALTAPFDWAAKSSDVEKEIDMLSEIESSRIVVTGTTALVGVTFTSQYQGEMTERIHNLISGIVRKADAGIQVVAVTCEKEDVDKINSIADQIRNGKPESELESEIDTIVRNVTTMQ